MQAIDDDANLLLQTWVTGAHLDRRFGDTVKTIEDDDFSIHAGIELDIKDDSPDMVSRAIGEVSNRLVNLMRADAPDLLVLLGDRYEILGAAIAALLSRVPVAHINGGEVTEGAIDDSIRHAVTKMSHLHFTSTDSYRDRVIQLGEDPERVYNVGVLSLDNINALDLDDLDDLQRAYDFPFNSPEGFFLVTYHPVTLDADAQSRGLTALIDALNRLKRSICCCYRR